MLLDGKTIKEIDQEVEKEIDKEIEKRIKALGAKIIECKKCGREIIFIETKGGNYMPTCLNLISHFADCPEAKKFRKL